MFLYYHSSYSCCLLPQERMIPPSNKQVPIVDEQKQSRDRFANDNQVCHMLTNHICSFASCSDHMGLMMLASDLFVYYLESFSSFILCDHSRMLLKIQHMSQVEKTLPLLNQLLHSLRYSQRYQITKTFSKTFLNSLIGVFCTQLLKYFIFVCFQQFKPNEDDIFSSFKNPTYTVSPE